MSDLGEIASLLYPNALLIHVMPVKGIIYHLSKQPIFPKLDLSCDPMCELELIASQKVVSSAPNYFFHDCRPSSRLRLAIHGSHIHCAI